MKTAEEQTQIISNVTGLPVKNIKAIESSIDYYTLPKVLNAIAFICKAKGDYIKENWQAPINANNRLGIAWHKMGRFIYTGALQKAVTFQEKIESYHA